MKKSNPRKKKAITGSPRKASTRGRLAEKRKASVAAGREFIRLASTARTLHARTNELHQKADDLHRSIEEMHGKAASKGQMAGERKLIAENHFGREESAEAAQKASSAKAFPIVGIGASAGGFEAFSEFLKYLPPHTGMAFVLVQHLDPKHKSQLTELLGRNSNVPVSEARDGVEVAPDHAYVIPANAHITIGGGRLRVAPRRENELPPMPVDAFLRSLAAEQQERAIGIVLSGTGTDGTLGIEAIKGEGGITFAQHESSAKFFGMPGSAINSGSVDFILPPDGIATELGRIAQHPYLGRAQEAADRKLADEAKQDEMVKGSEKEIGRLLSLLRARTGVDFALYKGTTLRRRIARQMILHKFDSLGQYLAYVEKQPKEVDSLFNNLLIYVTSFFRDQTAFGALKKVVFPKLAKAHSDGSPLRFWVCGCSTGEEAYSLAILLLEYFEDSHTHRHAQIFASDLSEVAISKARAGIYPENIVQDVSPERLRRFFVKTDGRYQVNKSLREMVVFARQNMIVDPPFSNLDLITCRNVLIYLDASLQRKVMPVFHYALRPHGFLMLGNSEAIGASNELFSLVNRKNKIYAKKLSYSRPAFSPRHKTEQAMPAAGQRPAALSPAELRTPDLQAQLDRLLLRDFTPAAVLVNSDLDVLHFRGHTGNYLEHPPGAATLNLLRMARENLAIDLRTAMGRAIKNDAHIKHKAHLRNDEHINEILIEVIPFKASSEAERFYLVIFRELGNTLAEPARHEKGRTPAAGREMREISRLRTELAATRESLQTVIEEQEANNEELKSANEEAQSSNEELQSTNEELETAKEELQSTNEELTTLNEELQTRNSELAQAINDLTNLLSSINIAILMLAEDLSIRRYTPMAERLFNLIPSDLGRRFNEVNRSILVPEIEQTVSSVITTLIPVERDVQDRQGHWYSLRIRPYRTRENRIEGVVILLVDVDQIKRALELMLSTAKEPLLTIGADLKVRKANEAFYRAFHLKAEETEGRYLYETGQGQWNTVDLRNLLEDILPQKKEIRDYPLEATFPEIGPRRLLINAYRFHDEGWGLQLILMAIEDVTSSSG